MTRTVAEEIYARVRALSAGSAGLSRAEAIRRVAADLGRTASATSSAYYAGARRAGASTRDASAAEVPAPALTEAPDAPERSSGHSDAGRLYEQMLPLVEAGGSVEQAARRFSAADDVDATAAGFRRWLARQDATGPVAARDTDTRVVALQAEVSGLRRELARTRQTLSRVRAIVGALDEE